MYHKLKKLLLVNTEGKNMKCFSASGLLFHFQTFPNAFDSKIKDTTSLRRCEFMKKNGKVNISGLYLRFYRDRMGIDEPWASVRFVSGPGLWWKWRNSSIVCASSTRKFPILVLLRAER